MNHHAIEAEAARVRQVTAGQIAAAPPAGPARVMYAAEAELQLLAAGRCWHQTGTGLPGFEYCAHPAPPAGMPAGSEPGDGLCTAGMCVRHAREWAGIEDPDLAVGDRVYELDPDADPGWHGTITAASNNGYRVRWDGQNGDLVTAYGEIAPAPTRPALRLVSADDGPLAPAWPPRTAPDSRPGR